MAKRSNFLKEFVKLAEYTEIPDIFALWSGVSAVSCVLGRQTWIDMGTYVLYPNLYVVLVAGSGRCRKSTAVGLAKKLLRRLEPSPNILAQKMTTEALIEALQIVEQEDSSRLLAKSSTGFLVVDELSTLLNKNSYDSGLGAVLTSFFDCDEVFEYHTKGRGKERLERVCLGLLGATTVEWIQSSLPEAAIGGGLTSRILFVYVDSPPDPVAWTEYSREKEETRDWLQRELSRIHMINGQFRLTDKAKKHFTELYEDFYRTSPFYEDKTLSGYASRRHTHLLKLAMIFSATERSDKKIDYAHIEGADWLLKKTESSLAHVLHLITASDKGAIADVIMRMIQTGGKVTKTEVMRRLSHKIDAQELDLTLKTLITAGRLQISVDGRQTYLVSTETMPKPSELPDVNQFDIVSGEHLDFEQSE